MTHIEDVQRASDRDLLVATFEAATRTETRVAGLEFNQRDHENRLRSLEDTRSQQAGVGRMARFALWAVAPIATMAGWLGAHLK